MQVVKLLVNEPLEGGFSTKAAYLFFITLKKPAPTIKIHLKED
jgi:hypothetical protein